MNSHAFAALAHIQILVLPVGPIPRAAFEKYAAEIRTFDSIRLGDIPTGMKDERARFMPNPLSSGYLYLSYPSHPPPPRHIPLSLFRPSHFTLGIIGVAACSSSYSLASALEQFENTVLDISPEGSTFPLAKVCFAFEDEESAGSTGLGHTLPGIVSIPSVMGNKKLYIGTLLADLCSHILAELGRVYHVLESPIGNEYLNSALFPTLPSPSEIPLSLSSGNFGYPSYSSQPELESSGLAAPGIQIKRSSTVGPGVSHASLIQRQSTLGPPAVRKRASAVGAVSSHGRLYKVLGDLFLLAGRTEDASLWYAEAIVLFKTGQDPVWHASVLEGMATVFVLDAWSAGQGLQSSVSNNGVKEPWADIYEQLSQAIALYHKTPVSSELSQDHSLLALTYCTAVMRQTSLLFCTWSTKGWGGLAFASMLQPGSTSYTQKTTSDSSWTNLERISIVSGVSRSQIANTVSQAHGPWLLHLGPHERLTILQSMASIYSSLGYRRKEAFILREVISCIMDLIVCGREENDILRKSDVGSAGVGNRSENGDEVNIVGKGAVGVRQNEILEGNQSILKLLVRACKVLGVDLEAVCVAKATDGTSSEVGGGDNNGPAVEDLDGSADTAKESFGWPELRVGVIREAIAVAEALPDPLAVARISLSALRTMHSVLASNDQYHLYQTAGRALAAMRRRGDAPAVEYWAGNPIMSLALLPLALHRLPIENLCSILTAKSSATNSLLSGTIDPFLYNPRKSSGPQSKNLIVQDEPIELTITLRNPYVFDLEIQNISLSTTGVEFESSPVSALVIPPNTLYPITIVGTAKTRGILVFRGCIVQAPWGAPREFLLPVPTDADQNLFARRQSAVKCESGRTKYWGLDSRPWEKDGKRLSALLPSLKKPPQFLQCVVVPEQPLLRIRWTSLTHGAVMLYNGEESTIRLTLENISALPIDFLRLSFEDSTIGPAQEALSEGELSVFEMYETEYDLLHRKAFSWRNEKEITNILPNQKVVLSVTCVGKVGCAHGTVHISYSQVNQEHEEQIPASDVFYTRQLSYPVTVTVYHMLECHDLSLMPMIDVDYDYDSINRWASNSVVHLLPEVDDLAEWCLFAIDVRNTYGLPFEVTFEREQAGTESAAVSSTVPPGSMSRIMLPVKKFRLSDDQISQPIPTLSDRQFVVGKSKLSIEEEQAQRELFWYREELLKIVSARWKETNGDRHGDLSLRQQRLTLPMLKALRTDVVQVDLTLIVDNPDGSPQELDYSGGKYIASPNEMLYLRVEAVNSSLSPLVMTLDLVFDPAEQVLSEGVSSDIAIGKLKPDETKAVEVPLCFLCTGRFEIGAEARVMGALRDSRVGASRVCISVREDG